MDESRFTKAEVEAHEDSLMCGACKEAFLPKRTGEFEREVDVVRIDGVGEALPVCPWCRDKLISAGVLKKSEGLPTIVSA